MKYNQYGWSNGQGLPVGMKSSLRATDWVSWNNSMELKSTEYNNVHYIEIPAAIDIDNNFSIETIAANRRNSDIQVRAGIDNVHPSSSAYKQIADQFYSAIQYFCL